MTQTTNSEIEPCEQEFRITSPQKDVHDISLDGVCSVTFRLLKDGSQFKSANTRSAYRRPFADSVCDAIGDPFLNECYKDNTFFQSLGVARPAIFGWTESYPLLILTLLLLIVLPTIFTKRNSPLKLSRIYNATRLGLLSILHHVCYSYSIAFPLSLMVFRPTPCIHSATFGGLHRLLNFPDAVIVAGAAFSFALSRFIGWSSLPAQLLVAACLMVVVPTDMGTNEATLLHIP
jgi:hypothetical protein